MSAPSPTPSTQTPPSSAHPLADAVLRSVGLRRTPVRVGVWDVLAGQRHPMDVADIIARLPADHPIDRVTVYRTLNTFVAKRIVHRVRGEDRSWRYAATTTPTPPSHGRTPARGRQDTSVAPAHRHPHFVCDDCGEVECLEEASVPPNFVRTMGVRKQYKVTHPEVTLHGSCPKCAGTED